MLLTLLADLSVTASSTTGPTPKSWLLLLFSSKDLHRPGSIPDATKNSCDALLTAMRERFASPNVQFLQGQELSDRKQGNGESFSTYTECIIRRCNRLGINDTDRMNYFISGLNSELKSRVILNRPSRLTKQNRWHVCKTPSIAASMLQNHPNNPRK